MGLCGSVANQSEDDKQAMMNSRVIDSDNKESWNKETQTKKLLLLGAGESGKSTLFKQMTQIYGNGFNLQDRTAYRMPIFNNTVQSMKTLMKHAEELPEEEGTRLRSENKKHFTFIEELRLETEIDKTVANAIKALWSDPGIKKTWAYRSKFQLPDSIDYFFENADRLADGQYVPTYEDMLRVRVRTTGIVEANFTIQQSKFRMIDVGGQRNERKKWIHCFEDVTGVIFVAAISEYDQMLYEDENKNRMDEAIELFDEICNSRWFKDTSMILFLNKKDIFEEKIKRVPLTEWSSEFSGDPHDYDETTNFLKDKFEDRNRNLDKLVYTHFSCALDKALVNHLFLSVKDIIIRRSLKEVHFVDG